MQPRSQGQGGCGGPGSLPNAPRKTQISRCYNEDVRGLLTRLCPACRVGDTICRGVAQPGRAPGSGPGGRRFKSSLPDQSFLPFGIFRYMRPSPPSLLLVFLVLRQVSKLRLPHPLRFSKGGHHGPTLPGVCLGYAVFTSHGQDRGLVLLARRREEMEGARCRNARDGASDTRPLKIAKGGATSVGK